MKVNKINIFNQLLIQKLGHCYWCTTKWEVRASIFREKYVKCVWIISCVKSAFKYVLPLNSPAFSVDCRDKLQHNATEVSEVTTTAVPTSQSAAHHHTWSSVVNRFYTFWKIRSYITFTVYTQSRGNARNTAHAHWHSKNSYCKAHQFRQFMWNLGNNTVWCFELCIQKWKNRKWPQRG